LAAGLDPQLRVLDRDGNTLGTYNLDQPAAALALGALGEQAVVALVDGPVMRFDLQGSKPTSG
jgi:hypothetical protein